ncbi:MAG: shikimate kinase [Brevinematales bacterium]|nr:shikimate kinase [Brevinematales bacterium]
MNIYLIGFRGSGKTTLGKILAKELHREFVDIDRLIEEKEREKISQIFNKKGEEYFRKIESLILKEISVKDNQVVSTGGGIVISEENRKIIKETGITIYLTTDIETTHKRIQFDKNRPQLTDKSPLEEIKFLIEKRRPYYEELADYTIDTSKNNIEQCVKNIKEFLLTGVKL